MEKPVLRVVIADDEPITRMDIKEILTEKGYEVIGEVADGFDAVEVCKAQKPDLVLMDIKMPEMNGLEATALIRQESKNIPIIALTAFAFNDDRTNALNAGCSDFLTKPIAADLLKETLRKYL